MDAVNLKKLAKELNLSVSTVSRALRDSYEISEETKKRVFDLAKELNYQPNPYASSLRKQKSKTIAVVLPEIANNFFTLAINGIEAVASERDYHVLIYITHEDTEKEISLIRHLQNGRVDGVIMSLSNSTRDIQHLIDLRQKGIPIVFFDRICEEMEAPKVTTDDYESGYKATEHLIKCGCTSIVHLSISLNLSITHKRMKGYLDALQHYKIKYDPRLMVQCDNDEEENQRLIYDLFNSKKRPDGVFASVEKLAINTYHACRELNLSIPKDVKVISFSNLETASLLNPSMTTITQPAYEIGKAAGAILFKRLEKKYANLPNERIVLDAKLIVRDSTLSISP